MANAIAPNRGERFVDANGIPLPVPMRWIEEISRILNSNTSSIEARLDAIELNNLVYVRTVSDFPAPVSGVITLEDFHAYLIDGDVNIGENRIVCGINSCIYGYSSEISYLHNTLDSQALVTSDETLSLYKITLYTAGTGASILDLDGSTSSTDNQALDWQFVNFSGGDVGTIKDYDNAIFSIIGFIDRSAGGFPAIGTGLTFDGTIDTIAITDSLLVSGTGQTAITIPSTATINRRFRMTDCAVVAFSGGVGIDFSTSSSVPNEGYVLNNVNFSGGSTYLSGFDYTYDETRFAGCRGIQNTYAVGHYTMQGNATATTIASTGTPVKVAGTTTVDSLTQKFAHTDNRLTYAGSLDRLMKVTATLSLTSGNNNQIGIYIAKNGTEINTSETYITANSSGRLENGAVQTISLCETGDYFEVWVENNTATTNITVEDLNVIISEV